MSYRVCIPTAGTGSRLGELTKYVNKSLVAIANRPTICHIIEQFPDDVEYVIALGHKGHLVKEFLTLAYPERVFLFSTVDPFEGEGSGLGLSLLCCKEYLQEPFIFISCDTLVRNPIPAPDHDWMGYAEVEDLSHYRTLRVVNETVNEICEKHVIGSDLKAYIGLSGVCDYRTFWQRMEQGADMAIAQGESFGLRALTGEDMKAYGFTWFDTGTQAALKVTREAYRQANEPNILEKADEAIWFVDDKVIKFSNDPKFIANRVERVKQLAEFVPTLLGQGVNMYMYRKVEGDVLSNLVTLPLFSQFLENCQAFWQCQKLSSEQSQEFVAQCRKFYHDKTKDRIKLFYDNFGLCDGTQHINGEPMPLMSDLIERVNWDDICAGVPVRFHGDFHFENILWSADEKRFVYLDWRQDFGGSLSTGDIYYDFGKLLHGLIVNHALINNNHFDVSWTETDIHFELHRRQVLVECEQHLMRWLSLHGFSVRKTRLMCALIYLNIAALHHHPYSLMLYALGKRMLKQELERI